jgi:NAD-dependent dihydropyrimidine dehydrogenase PreA subunit
LKKFTVGIDSAACKACGYCQLSCQQGVFEKGKEFNARGYPAYIPVRPENCTGCLQCFYACPDFAVTIEEKNTDEKTL